MTPSTFAEGVFKTAMMLLAPAIAGALVMLTPTTTPLPESSPPSTRPTMPLVLDMGSQSLGFTPLPYNTTASLGTELPLYGGRLYRLHLGVALGLHHHRQFAHSLYLDPSLGQRLTAPFGLYADVDLVVGGQLSRAASTTYRATDGERLRARRAPIKPAARIGLGLALGFDLGRVSKAPVRLFLRYRQYAQTPFMRGNDLPIMAMAAFTGGIAVEI